MVYLAERMVADVTETRNVIPSLEFKTCMTTVLSLFWKENTYVNTSDIVAKQSFVKTLGMTLTYLKL